MLLFRRFIIKVLVLVKGIQVCKAEVGVSEEHSTYTSHRSISGRDGCYVGFACIHIYIIHVYILGWRHEEAQRDCFTPTLLCGGAGPWTSGGTDAISSLFVLLMPLY